MILLAHLPASDGQSWQQAAAAYGRHETLPVSLLSQLEQPLQTACDHGKNALDSACVLLLERALLAPDETLRLQTLIRQHPGLRVVILSQDLDEESEWQLFKAGARGCCTLACEASLASRVIAAVLRDELWMRRALTGRLLQELALSTTAAMRLNQASTTVRSGNLDRETLASLTVREKEVAQLVARGRSNKEIARQLNVAERTVKAHLSEVFRKLGVSDRLKLALLIG